MHPEEIAAYFLSFGEPAYKAKQVFRWLSRGVRSFDEMTDISVKLREKLKQDCFLSAPGIKRKQISQQDGTIKYLWELKDGNAIESVFMRYEHGNTVCVSTQVGCGMGCVFCASSEGGLVRNLDASEILDQVIFTQSDTDRTVTNVVLMGIGEPLNNLDNVIRFLALINHKDGLNIGMRHITLSTCGIAERIDKLASYNLQLTLSISLHAPDDATRSLLMPVNKNSGIKKLLEACKRYVQKTGRRISFEYALIKGVNDSEWQAKLLYEEMAGVSGHINLIALNDVKDAEFKPGNVKRFASMLSELGANVTIRRRLGADIDAACGQLRKKLRSPSGKEERKVEP
jgi:23S rRNA (adenine2503-C2)-methyltransferase